MKKILFFAFALAAGVLAFTSCDKKGGNEPEDKDAVVFNVTGELRGVMFPVHNDQQQAVITLHPNAKTVDVKFVNARIASEDETPQDIFIHNMPVSSEDGHFSHINLVLADGSEPHAVQHPFRQRRRARHPGLPRLRSYAQIKIILCPDISGILFR